MSTAWRRISRAPHAACLHNRRHYISDVRPFASRDLVLLRSKLDRSAPPILTRPLKAAGQVHGHKGVINHDDIIGKSVRDVVKTATLRSGKDGSEYRFHEVRLEEYVRLSRRLVTPIYPADATLIVDLLDLHVEPFTLESEQDKKATLEILEAGTGHGALTLYLSRAIHGANPPRADVDDTQEEGGREPSMDSWKRDRRAIIHTVEVSAKYSAHAQNVVKGFRRGMYYHNVDFHVTDVGAWTQKTFAERDEKPFLSHAFLDLPNAESHLSIVAQALRTDGCIIVFNPSITQILDCVRKIKEEGILLELDTVIELGVNGSSGGREWNVRAVKPRTAQRKSERAEEEESDGDVRSEAEEGLDKVASNERVSMICRPKVGERIVGGGFLGVWRKQRDMTTLQ